jgi:hypothetical protein
MPDTTLSCTTVGGVAQLVERLTGSQEVRGFESHHLHHKSAVQSHYLMELSPEYSLAGCLGWLHVESPYTFAHFRRGHEYRPRDALDLSPCASSDSLLICG